MSFRIFVRDQVFRHYKWLVGPMERERYLAQTASPKLNLGCGGNRIPGWLNVDLCPPPGAVYMNAARRWPFPDATFDALLCEHMIEHVPKPVAVYALHEAARVLKPGAPIRIVTPDLGFFANLALGAAGADGERYVAFMNRFTGGQVASACDTVNLNFYGHGHCYIYSAEELGAVMREAGFTHLAQSRAARAIDPVFEGAEGHPKLVGEAIDAIEAFAIEARKPPVGALAEAQDQRVADPVLLAG